MSAFYERHRSKKKGENSQSNSDSHRWFELDNMATEDTTHLIVEGSGQGYSSTEETDISQSPFRDTDDEELLDVTDIATTSSFRTSPRHSLGRSYNNGAKPTATIQSAGFFSVAKDNGGRPLIGHCLTDHVMKTVPARTKLRCAAECIHEVGCKSINYKDGVCELNEETRASVLSSYFSKNDGCSYYELI